MQPPLFNRRDPGGYPRTRFRKRKRKIREKTFVSFFSFLNLTLTRFSRVLHGKGMLLAVLETPRLPHCPGLRWMRACIAYERLNELHRRRLLRRTSPHNALPLLIGAHPEVLHLLQK